MSGLLSLSTDDAKLLASKNKNKKLNRKSTKVLQKQKNNEYDNSFNRSKTMNTN